MTVHKGEAWGQPAVCPAGLRVVSTDRDVREWILWHRVRGESIGDLGVAGGDLARTCGGGSGRHPSSAMVTVDVMRIALDGGAPTWGAAHIVARRQWLRGDVALVMNAQFYGPYDVAPRSHPNDGKVDVLRVDPAMGWRERVEARRRARTGSHLPNRKLSLKSVSEVELRFETASVVWIDGVRIGSAQHLDVCVEPDAMTIYV